MDETNRTQVDSVSEKVEPPSGSAVLTRIVLLILGVIVLCLVVFFDSKPDSENPEQASKAQEQVLPDEISGIRRPVGFE